MDIFRHFLKYIYIFLWIWKKHICILFVFCVTATHFHVLVPKNTFTEHDQTKTCVSSARRTCAQTRRSLKIYVSFAIEPYKRDRYVAKETYIENLCEIVALLRQTRRSLQIYVSFAKEPYKNKGSFAKETYIFDKPTKCWGLNSMDGLRPSRKRSWLWETAREQARD